MLSLQMTKFWASCPKPPTGWWPSRGLSPVSWRHTRSPGRNSEAGQPLLGLGLVGRRCLASQLVMELGPAGPSLVLLSPVEAPAAAQDAWRSLRQLPCGAAWTAWLRWGRAARDPPSPSFSRVPADLTKVSIPRHPPHALKLARCWVSCVSASPVYCVLLFREAPGSAKNECSVFLLTWKTTRWFLSESTQDGLKRCVVWLTLLVEGQIQECYHHTCPRACHLNCFLSSRWRQASKVYPTDWFGCNTINRAWSADSKGQRRQSHIPGCRRKTNEGTTEIFTFKYSTA